MITIQKYRTVQINAFELPTNIIFHRRPRVCIIGGMKTEMKNGLLSTWIFERPYL